MAYTTVDKAKANMSATKFSGTGSSNSITGVNFQPDCVWIKARFATTDWVAFNSLRGTTKKLIINETNIEATDANSLTAFGTDGFTLGSEAAVNTNGNDYIAYCWHNVPGLQKFGTYSGNSNADGPFIELGFRPALFVMKQTDSTGYWMVYDSARDPINDGSPYYLFWNDDSAQGTGYDLDFLSNGVKLRTDNANFNTTSYVYAAWAEAPSIDLYGGGANAR